MIIDVNGLCKLLYSTFSLNMNFRNTLELDYHRHNISILPTVRHEFGYGCRLGCSMAGPSR
jgi:hypothetical protein